MNHDKNLKFIDGNWYIDITLNKKRIRMIGGDTKEKARITLEKLRMQKFNEKILHEFVLGFKNRRKGMEIKKLGIKEIKESLRKIESIIEKSFPFNSIISVPIHDMISQFLYIDGVYILYSKKKIIYIGASSNVGLRLKAHFSNYKDEITDVDIIRIKKNDDFGGIIALEAFLIDHFNPIHNKTNPYLCFHKLSKGFNLDGLIYELEEKIK